MHWKFHKKEFVIKEVMGLQILTFPRCPSIKNYKYSKTDERISVDVTLIDGSLFENSFFFF